MRRLAALAIALVALLAIADLLHEASPAPAQRHVASAHLTAPSAPEPDVPALTPATVRPSVSAHAGTIVEPTRHLAPVFHVVAIRQSPSVLVPRSGKPRAFPLLI